MSDSIIERVVEQLQTLPEELQHEVLRFAQQLNLSPLPVVGLQGNDLLQFAGQIPSAEIAEMKLAIEEDCAKIDINEW
ncbi:MAG TPA: hypothetical protein VLL52_12870 [Anaerolineae bacterium]|nr:hypothetical protein [Anaerolineae bacterium]